MSQTYCMGFLDLDGTTLLPDSTLSQRTIRAVRRVTAVGVQLVLASARPPRTILPYREELGLSSPTIAYNGAVVLDASGRVLFREHLERSIAAGVVRLIRQRLPSINISLECDDIWHIDRVDEDLRETLHRYRISPPHTVGQVDRLIDSGEIDVTKLLFSGGDRVPELAAEFQAAFGRSACFVPTGGLVEIVAEGVSKGAAAAELCRRLCVDSVRVFAVGDQYNDIPMLDFAGLAVAMGNAPPGVKEVAARVVPTHTNDGLAILLEDLLENELLSS